MVTVETVKQICLGVAVAGVVAAAGSAVATAVAYAEPTDSGSHSAAGVGAADSSSGATTPRVAGGAVATGSTKHGAGRDSGGTKGPSAGQRVPRTPGLPSAAPVAGTASARAVAPRSVDGRRGGPGRPAASARGGATDPTIPAARGAAAAGRKNTPPARDAGSTPGPIAGGRLLQTTRSPSAASVLRRVGAEALPVDSVSTMAADEAPPMVSRRVTAWARDSVVATAAVPAVGAAPARVVLTPVIPAPIPIPIPIPLPLPVPLVPAAPASVMGVSSLSFSSTSRSRRTSTGDAVAQISDPTTQHVLVIGVDGTNLSRVLADPANENFFDLMDTAPPPRRASSGTPPSPTPRGRAILTGVWDTKTGVINNVFTPGRTTHGRRCSTNSKRSIRGSRRRPSRTGDVITDIAGAGATPGRRSRLRPAHRRRHELVADRCRGRRRGRQDDRGTDPGYEDVPNFLFTYLVQVDENGHHVRWRIAAVRGGHCANTDDQSRFDPGRGGGARGGHG